METVRRWNTSRAVIFALLVCAFSWAFTIAGSYGPQIRIAIPGINFAIGSKFILLMAGPLLPALICFFRYPECRPSLKKWNAGTGVYLLAIATGFILPFAAHFGSHYPSTPWNRADAVKLLRVFVINLLLSPLWEELIWRGCFFKKLMMFLSPQTAMVASSLAWAFWHGGFLFYLYSEGVPTKVLIVMPVAYFFSGILLCSTFLIAKESLWPCVLMHSAMNASTLVYYANYDRLSEVSSYVAELVAMAIAAILMYRLATRSARVVEPVSEPEA